MGLFRRDFLQLGLLQAISAAWTSKAMAGSLPQLERSGLSILQGATDRTRTQFSIVHAIGQKLQVTVQSIGQVIQPDSMVTKGFAYQNTEVTRVFFSGLSVNQDFTLMVVDADTGIMVDSRVFQTLDVHKSQLKFAMCSCMDNLKHEPGIWQNLVNSRPDIIFFIGDSVYCDYGPALAPSPERLWRRFSEARKTLEIYYSKRLIPIVATWDDHDFAGNDAYSNYRYVQESQENFLTFFAQETSHCSVLRRGPGVSSALTISNQLFLLMDDRSFRLQGGSSNRYAHWGKDQEEWAVSLIRSHQGPSWFFNGTQIFPQMFLKESVSGHHSAQFEGLKSELRNVSSRVVFGSGDVHYSEISRIEPEAVGYQTYEITSSAVHSPHFPGAPDIFTNDRRIASTGNKNYLMVQATARDLGVQMTVTSESKNAGVNFRMSLIT